MISPHTPAGTLVVCIDDEPWTHAKRKIYGACMHGLKKGGLYTTALIFPAENSLSGFGVTLVEIDRGNNLVRGFATSRFSPAVLPGCLTEILARQPIRETEKA